MNEGTTTDNLCEKHYKLHLTYAQNRPCRKHYYKMYESRPERIAQKKLWKKLNYEKVVKSWLKRRQRIYNDPDERKKYKERNNENLRKWRERNPERMQEYNNKNKLNPSYKYKKYKLTALKHNKEFTISEKDATELFAADCEYCGYNPENGLNGIDRVDNSKGYIVDNVVTCCRQCNFMKGGTDVDVFIGRCIHIATYAGLFQGKLFPVLFPDRISTYFKRYVSRALERGYNFNLTEDQFNDVISMDCYLCGKKNSKHHQNGVDRIDSSIDYNMDNVKACCASCNYFKNEFDLDDVYEKCVDVALNNYDETFELDEDTAYNLIHIVRMEEKLSEDEYQELKDEYMEEKYQELLDKYSDETIEKRVETIVNNRSEN